MLLLWLIRVVSGWVRVRVSGRFPERFLNVCAHSGVILWDTRKESETIVCCLFARDFKRLKALRRGCSVKVKLTEKRGLPFFAHRYRRRQGLVCGACIFVAVMLTLPRFVWSVDINCTGDADEAQVRKALEVIGLEAGTPISRVDAGNMRVQLALKVPNIAWASINTDATNVTVDVRGAAKKQVGDRQLSNITAASDGRVTDIRVRKGSAVVKVGDAVTAGQMLVSGTAELRDGTTVFTHSDADIFASTERTLTVKVPLEREDLTDTGRSCKRTAVGFFGLKVPLYLGGIDYDFRSTARRDDLVIGGVKLPVWRAQAEFFEVERRRVTLSEKAARTECEALLKSEEERVLANAEIVARKVSFVTSRGEMTATGEYECVENIAENKPYYIENTP